MGDQKIIKTGNSLAVTIPSHFVKTVGIRAGQTVGVQIDPESGRVTYAFSGMKQLSLSHNFVKKSRRQKKNE